VTTVIAFAIGTFAGVASAWWRGGRLDAVLPPTLFIVSTVPVFFVGLLLVYVFAVKLNWLPLQGTYSVGATPSFSLSFIWDVLKHALLPALSLVIVTAGLWVYSMRNNMITTIAEDYVKTARAKGLPNRRIMFGYAGRNAILPNLTGFAMQLGYVLGGAIVVEYLFSYPGLGYLFYTATTDHDLPLMQGLFLVYTLAVLICVLIADLITGVLDPRTREA
jgi:peptide/nickel transport system permease protein